MPKNRAQFHRFHAFISTLSAPKYCVPICIRSLLRHRIITILYLSLAQHPVEHSTMLSVDILLHWRLLEPSLIPSIAFWIWAFRSAGILPSQSWKGARPTPPFCRVPVLMPALTEPSATVLK